MRQQKFWNWKLFAISTLSLLLLLTLLSRLDKTPTNPSTFDYLRIATKTPKPLPKPRQPKIYNPDTPSFTSKGEEKCKVILEKVFGKNFSKVRPDFLKNQVTGKNLELDLYNEELNLCAEFNGRQHYEYVPYFHQNKEAFYNQRYRDEMKKKKCQEMGINYLEIPYEVKLDDMENYIIKKLKDFGYNI